MLSKTSKGYFYSNGKRISEKEYLRRRKISKALIKFNKGKKDAITKKLNVKRSSQINKRNGAKRSSTISTRDDKNLKTRRNRRNLDTIRVIRKRTTKKVKTVPKKGQDNFYFADKTYYELETPLILEKTQDVKNIKKAIKEIKPMFIEDFKKLGKKERIVNLGYDLKLEFVSKDGKSKKTINNTSYTENFSASNKTGLENALTDITKEIEKRFQKYLVRTGFNGVKIFGFESEISNKSVNQIIKDMNK